MNRLIALLLFCASCASDIAQDVTKLKEIDLPTYHWRMCDNNYRVGLNPSYTDPVLKFYGSEEFPNVNYVIDSTITTNKHYGLFLSGDFKYVFSYNKSQEDGHIWTDKEWKQQYVYIRMNKDEDHTSIVEDIFGSHVYKFKAEL